MTPSAVSFRGVVKKYPDFTLDKINLDLPIGGIMGLIGPNGAGKSTTLRILMGLIHQDQGEVHVLGHEIPQEQTLAKQSIGYVSEDMRLYPAATLDWHMSFVGSFCPRWDETYAKTLLNRFDLKRHQKVKALSHGQRVKATLLLVLARRPQLLVLDEPTTGLDPVARHEVLNEMMDVLLDEERTILFSSHNTKDVEQISDRITFIDRGRVVACAEKEEFLENWRRIRLEVPSHVELPQLPAIVSVQRNGALAVVTTDRFTADLPTRYEAAGAGVQGVESLSLEEIFLASVLKDRKEEAA